MKTKICSKCKKEKDIKEFSKDRTTKDGLRYWCKECVSKYNKEFHQKNKEKHTDKYYQNLNGTKRCFKCGEVKDISKFSKNRTKKDGLHNRCKQCDKKYYQNNKPKLLIFKDRRAISIGCTFSLLSINKNEVKNGKRIKRNKRRTS